MSNKMNFLKVLAKREQILKDLYKITDKDLQNTNNPNEIARLDIKLNKIEGAIEEIGFIANIIELLGEEK